LRKVHSEMEAFVKNFFSVLHRDHLKPRGYTKERFTFSRDAGEFVERVQFQGSQWNSAGEPWQFYINVGVQFKDLPPRSPDRDFPRTHAWSRIENIVPGIPAKYQVSPTTVAALASELNTLLAQASASVSALASPARAKCATGKYASLGAT